MLYREDRGWGFATKNHELDALRERLAQLEAQHKNNTTNHQ